MLALKGQKDITGVKDIIKDRAEKLAAAIYLVTNFMADSDQIKWQLRHQALDLKVKLTISGRSPSLASVASVVPVEAVLSDINEIISLIDIAVLDRQASAMNFSILREGYLGLQNEFQSYVASDWYKNTLIPVPVSFPIGDSMLKINPNRPSLPSSDGRVGKADRAGINPKSLKNSDNRREKIVNFIKQHNWCSIREIAKFFPDIGSKTIQRELVELIRIGTLKKTGERRWSRYGLPVRQPAD